MADVKQSFIDALNTTPDGIDAFLETPIPTVAAFAMPTDVDSSIIAQGKLSYNINEILRAFGGLTPIELLLRIGQHNSVLQGALLAGLEYIEQEEFEFIVLAPQGGITYTDNPVPVEIEITKGITKVSSCTGYPNNGSSFTLAQDGENPAFYSGELAWSENGTITVNLTVVFNASDGPYDCTKVINVQVENTP